uniref:NADH-ubiquinone oxidoreductase chain 3 n=1 Tax=Botryllus schlosseri TaxID=30301 RepID=A0A024GWQ4_BOTSH|nr:NADH dehydrogenase subunit 3 [Botryllus schlosseri]
MFIILLVFFLYFSNYMSALTLLGTGIIYLLYILGSKVLIGDNNFFVLFENKSYECGFEYGLEGGGFSLQFYIVGLSFLLFDLEICLFTPVVLSLNIGMLSLGLGVFFLLMVLFLLIYEFLTGALDWS